EFAEIEEMQSAGQWDTAAEVLGDAARKLEACGADYIVICTNTMHKVAPQIQRMISVPVIHIADATAEVLKQDGIRRIALLGTRYTMTQDFYKQRLIDQGFEVLIPEEKDIEPVNRIIFEELCVGEIKDESRKEYQRIIQDLKDRGAEGVILGCTEIGMLISQEDSVLPVYDTTLIHAQAAAKAALAE
ncbi:MAG: amino acid racemase, partial [Solobacterium sp.]|nr:amino acid racemase [Solobacterium sp.]